MARQIMNDTDKMFSISGFLGINQSPDGDSNLKLGEARAMLNYKITDAISLQKRPGTQNVANLLFNYDIDTGDAEIVRTEINAPTAAFTMYSNYNITNGGVLYVNGTPVTVNQANSYDFAGVYWQSPSNNIFRFWKCDYVNHSDATHISGGWVTLGPEMLCGYTGGNCYASAAVANGAVAGASPVGYKNAFDMVGLYTNGGYPNYIYSPNALYLVTRIQQAAMYNGKQYYPVNEIFGQPVTFCANDTWNWWFYPLNLIPNTSDSVVRGIWSGRVGDSEVICAACNNRLWALMRDDDGTWSKGNVGSVDTTKPVRFFGFDSKVYLQNGSQYLSWDGAHHFTCTFTYHAGIGGNHLSAGNYYVTMSSVNYHFTIASTMSSCWFVYDDSNKSLTLNYYALMQQTPTVVSLPYTTGAVTTQTNLMSVLNVIEATDPVTGQPTAVTVPAVVKSMVIICQSSVNTVTGYRPLVSISVPYSGGGTTLERVNMLNGQRRVRFSPDGTHATFTLPEQNLSSIDYAKVVSTGAALTVASSDLIYGTATLSAAPANGTNTIEIGYTVPTTFRSQIEAMTLSELYNGENDNRVFVYGDGSNKAYYSDLDYSGTPTAEYFPDGNVVSVGASNTPIYDLLHHYSELMAFKDGSAHRIKYGDVSLSGGAVTAAFYVETVNKDIGGSGYGQAQLVNNRPRTLDGRSIYEWAATMSTGLITTDQRNAQKISRKVETTIRAMDLTRAITYYDKINHEYFAVENGTAIVQNTENGAWYIYDNFPAVCLINYKDDLYMGTADGFIRRISRDYRHDCGAPIACTWESGSMDFGTISREKYSDLIWLRTLPEDAVSATATLETNINPVFNDFAVTAGDIRIQFKAKNYTWLKLKFHSTTNDTTVTLLKAEIRVRPTSLSK